MDMTNTQMNRSKVQKGDRLKFMPGYYGTVVRISRGYNLVTMELDNGNEVRMYLDQMSYWNPEKY